jgi:hypothetical protein
VCQCCVEGVSSGAVDDVVRAPGVQGLSKSQVAEMAWAPAGTVAGLRSRPLDGGHCARLWLDAPARRVRERGRTADVLRRYDIQEIDGQLYVCQAALGLYHSIGDKDCSAYRGGDPALAGYRDLYCSPREFGSGLECRRDYYPSEARDVEFVRIDYQDHVCRRTYGGRECWATTAAPSPRDGG